MLVLWLLIRYAYPVSFLISDHNICFCGEISKLLILFSRKKYLIQSEVLFLCIQGRIGRLIFLREYVMSF